MKVLWVFKLKVESTNTVYTEEIMTEITKLLATSKKISQHELTEIFE